MMHSSVQDRANELADVQGGETAPYTPSWHAAVTAPACVAVDREWWRGRYGQWDTSNVGTGAPRAVVRFARLAEREGWSVALRAGTHSLDDETGVGVWEVEATGRCHDNNVVCVDGAA